MTEGLLIGITQALDEEFGPDMSIYTDDIEQGIETPCFLVTDLISTEEQILGSRYERRYPFMVQYFPKERHQIKEEKMNTNIFQMSLSDMGICLLIGAVVSVIYMYFCIAYSICRHTPYIIITTIRAVNHSDTVCL